MQVSTKRCALKTNKQKENSRVTKYTTQAKYPREQTWKKKITLKDVAAQLGFMLQEKKNDARNHNEMTT